MKNKIVKNLLLPTPNPTTRKHKSIFFFVNVTQIYNFFFQVNA